MSWNSVLFFQLASFNYKGDRYRRNISGLILHYIRAPHSLWVLMTKFGNHTYSITPETPLEQ